MQSESQRITRRVFVTDAAALSAVWIAAAACAREKTAASGDSGSAMLHPSATEAAVPPHELQHFSKAQAADIDAIAARIIPTDDTPGAREAGVVYFIDRTLETFGKEQAPLFDAGLQSLASTVRSKHGAGATFAGLTTEQQDTLLKGIEKSDFFGAMRFATVAGFLSLPKYGGNKDYIGWKFIGQDRTFEHKPPFGWYDRAENQQSLIGKVL